MKKKKCNPPPYFYQTLNLNYLMLKTNENNFKLLSFLIWITEVYIQGLMIRFSAFYKPYVSKKNNVFCIFLLLLCVAMYLRILQFFYYITVFCYDFVFENKWLIDWLIEIFDSLQWKSCSSFSLKTYFL